MVASAGRGVKGAAAHNGSRTAYTFSICCARTRREMQPPDLGMIEQLADGHADGPDCGLALSVDARSSGPDHGFDPIEGTAPPFPNKPIRFFLDYALRLLFERQPKAFLEYR